jgi:hypothetical protein
MNMDHLVQTPLPVPLYPPQIPQDPNLLKMDYNIRVQDI